MRLFILNFSIQILNRCVQCSRHRLNKIGARERETEKWPNVIPPSPVYPLAKNRLFRSMPMCDREMCVCVCVYVHDQMESVSMRLVGSMPELLHTVS